MLDTLHIPTRALIYCRMSRDREGAGLGIDRQRDDCEQLARHLGVDIVAVYEDNDLSAYSGKPRPDYQRLLDDLRAGRADTVLAWHTDRIHRSPAELEEYIDICEPRKIQTRTVKAGHLDLTTATGRMIARQLGVQARYEVERMIERQKRKREEMVQHGKFFGGRRPFGYAADGITVIDDEAEAIREAAAAILAGASLRHIAAGWNQRGIPTSTGGTWKGPEVRSMLLRPRNAGIIKHRGEEAGPAIWAPVLDEPLWRSMCAVLDDPGRRTAPGNERKYLGSNIYLCGLCGQTMRCSTGNKTKGGVSVPSYSCRASKHLTRRCDLLDDYIMMLILGRLSRPDAADMLAEREDPIDVRGAQRDMREARETLTELAQELGAGAMDMLEWRAASKAARTRLKAAENVLSRAVEVNPVVGLVGVDDVEAAWNRLGLSRQRAVLVYLMAVTVRPARRGRLPGGVYFDADSIDVVWK